MIADGPDATVTTSFDWNWIVFWFPDLNGIYGPNTALRDPVNIPLTTTDANGTALTTTAFLDFTQSTSDEGRAGCPPEFARLANYKFPFGKRLGLSIRANTAVVVLPCRSSSQCIGSFDLVLAGRSGAPRRAHR